MKNGILTFDPVPHQYTVMVGFLAPMVLPSVSDIIRPLSDMSAIPAPVLDFARVRGVAVHRACHLHDMGDLDEESLDDHLVGYLNAWKKFNDACEPNWTQMEMPDWHERLMYAGTPDRVGTAINAKGKRVTVKVDMKATYALNPAVQVQLSGYDLLTPEPADELWSVRLKSDGTYDLKVHKPAHGTFLACLNVYRWQEANKCLPPKS